MAVFVANNLFCAVEYIFKASCDEMAFPEADGTAL